MDHFERRLEGLNMKRSSRDTIGDADNNARDQFYAKIFHEMRTAVHGICGMTGVLKEIVKDASQLEHIDTIGELGSDLDRLCNDILKYQITQSSEFSLELSPCDLRRRLEHLVAAFLPEARRNNTAILLDLKMLPDRVVCDGTRIIQVFHNLMQNAMNHADCRQIMLGITNVDANDSHTVLHGFVEDSGKGIPADQLKHLFKPFRKRPGSRGAGLGLAICAQLVERMGGTISVESHPTIGCRFEFTVRVGAVTS